MRNLKKSQYLIGLILSIVILLLIVRVSAAILLITLLVVLSISRVHEYLINKLSPLRDLVRHYAGHILFIQCATYAIAYNALMPEGMYFSPDSIQYLSVSNVVHPIFALSARALVDFELGLGSSRIVLLRYTAIAVYCLGGWLISKALIRSGRPAIAIFVIPTLWSMSGVTMWFNYYLTDGIASAFLVACIGAYANMFVSTQEGEDKNQSSWWWLVMFVLFGMLAVTIRPAFIFVVPVMIVLMMGKTIFSARRIIGVVGGVAMLLTLHIGIGQYWNGHGDSHLGGALTALVFDLPLPEQCSTKEGTNICKVQRALNPFIQESLGRAPQQRFIYKAENNGNVFWAALSSLRKGTDKPGEAMTVAQYEMLSAEQKENMLAELEEMAYVKIKSNIKDYISMVLINSYYSVKTWGDWYKHDNLGSVAMQGVDITNANSAAVISVIGTNFDPAIKNPPIERFYKDYLFQGSRLLLNGHFVADHTFSLLVIVLSFSILPFIFPTSVQGAILFACCLLGIAGTIAQNAVFPVIPRLLQPFQALGALGALMLISMAIDKVTLSLTVSQGNNKLA